MNAQPYLANTYSHSKLKALPICEQPAYRVAKDSDACNLAELLAVIIGGSSQIEVAERLLSNFGTVHKIAQAHPDEISKVQGVGNVTALRIKASLALGRKLLQPIDDQKSIHNPEDAANILMPLMAHREQEYMIAIPIDTRNHVLDVIEVYHGSLNGLQIRIGDLFKPVLVRNAASVIFAHNHPSGDPTPSHEDISTTRSLVQAGKLLDVDVLDHMIIGLNCWTSLKEKGLGFS